MLSPGILRFRNPTETKKKKDCPAGPCSPRLYTTWLYASQPSISELTNMENQLLSDSDPLSMANGSPVRARSNWVVQKFGGTSVGKFALNIIDQVVLYAFNLFFLTPLFSELPWPIC